MPPIRVTVACLLGGLVLLAACTSGGDGAGPSSSSPTGSADDLIATVASYDLTAGEPIRVIVGLEGGDRQVVAFGTVAMRFAYLGTRDAHEEQEVYGEPVTARYLPIPGTDDPPEGGVGPQLVSGSRSRGVYAAEAGFDRPGFWRVEVTAEVDGEQRTGRAAFEVLDEPAVVAVGDRAPRTENHTLDSPDVPRVAIDSRAGRDGSQPIPDPELHHSTVADAIEAGRPVVVVVSTPVYCISRFCGPITDMVGELAVEYLDRASFVHLEVYRDHDNNVINEAAAEWIYPDRTGQPTEPWVFVVGADGVVTHRFDNVATRADLEPIVSALPVIGPPGEHAA